MKRAKQTLGLFLFYLVSVSVSNVGLFAGSASAATFTVTSTGDNHDPQPGDGSCGWPKSSPFYAIYSAVYPCTLRAAIEEVNAQRPGTGPQHLCFRFGFWRQLHPLSGPRTARRVCNLHRELGSRIRMRASPALLLPCRQGGPFSQFG